jgi:hypothetical protein
MLSLAEQRRSETLTQMSESTVDVLTACEIIDAVVSPSEHTLPKMIIAQKSLDTDLSVAASADSSTDSANPPQNANASYNSVAMDDISTEMVDSNLNFDANSSGAGTPHNLFNEESATPPGAGTPHKLLNEESATTPGADDYTTTTWKIKTYTSTDGTIDSVSTCLCFAYF